MKGGYKPGGGRPKGSVKLKAGTTPLLPAGEVVGTLTSPDGNQRMTPLEYMLRIINDPSADVTRRDRLAMAAAPFVHERVADTIVGKKQKMQAAAATAGEDSDWGDDLRSEEARPN